MGVLSLSEPTAPFANTIKLQFLLGLVLHKEVPSAFTTTVACYPDNFRPKTRGDINIVV